MPGHIATFRELPFVNNCWECEICGVVVTDTQKHIDWHTKTYRLIETLVKKETYGVQQNVFQKIKDGI